MPTSRSHKSTKKGKNSPNEGLQRLEQAFVFKSGPRREYKGKKAILRSLLDGILGRCHVELKYMSPAGEDVWDISIMPHKFIVYKGSFYILAVPVGKGKDEFRLYLVDRMANAKCLEKTFRPFSTAKFEDRMKQSFGLLVDGDLTTVRITFQKGLATYLQERVWHPSQRFQQTNDGITLEMDILLNHEIVPWIVGWGKQVKKVEPVKLRKMVEKETC